MADENEQDERHPYEIIAEKADSINFTDEEDREDWIEAKMRRAGFKKGPGAWVAVSDDDDDDDGEHDDDDQPMTRGDWRRIQRDRKKSSSSNYTPPRRKRTTNEGGEGGKKRKPSGDAWW